MGGVRDWLVGGGDDSAVAMGGDLPQRPRRRGEDLQRRGSPTRTFSDSAGGTDVQTTEFRWWVWLVCWAHQFCRVGILGCECGVSSRPLQLDLPARLSGVGVHQKTGNG